VRVGRSLGACRLFNAVNGRYCEGAEQPGQEAGIESVRGLAVISTVTATTIIPAAVTLTLALAQVNPTVGDLAGNAALVRRTRDQAAAAGADLVVFPELVLVGYPPEDLVLRPAVVEAAAAVLRELVRESTAGGPGLVITLPSMEGGRLYNTAAFVADGAVECRFKHELPNYGVFDEKRLFTPGPLPDPVRFRGIGLGLPICEDLWFPEVARQLAHDGAEILLGPNGSPFEVGKCERRLDLARARARETGLPVVYVNQVGGQDELVFDGGSFVIQADGELAATLPLWRDELAVTRWTREDGRLRCNTTATWTHEPRPAAIWAAMRLGLRDYVEKNRFGGVVIGLSGGIDSALTAAVAVDALGPARVRGVRLPSRFTSEASMDDAGETARLLGIRLDTLPIEAGVSALEATVGPLFAGRPRDTTEENLQARVRGVLLMALSNKFGELLVTTGNKSEMSVGYSTLYGDMCGGYSVLKDIYKTEVYALARWRNTHHPDEALGPAGRAIPESSITKAPTAELRPNQTDQDSLPPYDELDAILTALVEDELGVREIVDRGFPRGTVLRVQRMLYTAEYKRRQAPPGVKITRRSFGRDRRYPMTNAFRDE
jgi:NAD+ synthase